MLDYEFEGDQIADVIPHPKYFEQSPINKENDIGLIFLALSDSFNPISMNSDFTVNRNVNQNYLFRGHHTNDNL